MRNLLSLAIALSLPIAASAGEQACLVSFSGAQQNVCTGASSAPALQSLLSLSPVKDSTLRLVKFGGPITQQQRAAVEAAGAKIISYAPYYAYIVRMPAERDSAMRAVDGVVWSGPLMPALKVDANIYSELQGNKIVEGLGVSSLEISVDATANGGVMRSAVASIPGLTVSNSVTTAGVTRILASFSRAQLGAAVEELAMSSDVLSVGFRKPMRLSNSQGHWMHQSNVNTPAPSMPIWDKGLYGCGQIIGELDTGLWMDNVAFKDDSQPMPIDVCNDGAGCPGIATPNYDARKVIAYYKWSGLAGGSWGDNHGHGTHVAGSILGNNNVANPGTDCENFTTPGGDTNLDGMAPGAKLVMQETGGNLAYLNTQGGNPYHMAKIAYDNGARLHSDSWGGGCVSNTTGQCIAGCTVTYDEMAQDADRVMRDHDDLLLVFAAGNDATVCSNGNNVGSPGNAKNVLTIGATGRGAAGNNMASFSSRGPTLDARTKPELGAQGNGIVSAGRSASGTATMSGTSMATPTTSGLAALVRDYLARGFYPTGLKNPANAITTPSGALIKAILTVGAVQMTGTGAGVNPGQAQGFGRVLLKDSLYFDGTDKRLFIHDEPAGLATNDVAEHSLTVTAGQPLTVVLTWTDTEAAVNASPATVNSLRLEVQAPNGDIWTQKLPAGYGVSNANPTQDTTTSNYDNLNTLQRITLPTPEVGTYLLRVRGINVPSGPQKYALAANGSFNPQGALYSVGGETSGLTGAGLVLQLNDGDDLPISADGAFAFPNGLADGSDYAVTVATQPSGAQFCSVANGSGTIADANVTDVEVTCADDRIFADGFDGDGLPVEPAFSENFDAYVTGSNVHGQGGWKGWGNDSTAGAIVSADQHASAPNSINIEGGTDLIHEFSKFTSGSWTITAKQYIPVEFSGQSYFIFENVYSDTDMDVISWSTQIYFDSSTNQLSNEDGAANPFSATLIKGRWVDLKLVVDLDKDLQTFSYDGTQLYSGSWTNQFPDQDVPGSAAIGSIDLWANDASPVYYDDIKIVPTAP